MAVFWGFAASIKGAETRQRVFSRPIRPSVSVGPIPGQYFGPMRALLRRAGQTWKPKRRRCERLWLPQTWIPLDFLAFGWLRVTLDLMIQTLRKLFCQFASCFRSRAELELENLVLRHQIEILRRSAPKRVRLAGPDRFLFTMVFRLLPRIAQSIRIVHPKTVVRWHREGFRIYWR